MPSISRKLKERIEPKRVAALCENLRLGLHFGAACKLADLCERTVFNWRKYAKEGKQPFASYVSDIEKAEVQAEQVLVAKIQRAASSGTWTAAAWILERRWPERWAKPDYMKAQPPGGVRVVLDWVSEPKKSREEVKEDEGQGVENGRKPVGDRDNPRQAT
jgi:transposase